MDMKNPDDYLFKIFKELKSIKGNDRHYILVLNGFLEILVNVLIEDKLKEPKSIIRNNYATRLLFIYTTGLINNELYLALNVLKDIRNQAAHDPLFRVKTSDFKKLSEEYNDPTRFEFTCIEIFAKFWNKYSDLFNNKFAKNFHKQSQNKK